MGAKSLSSEGGLKGEESEKSAQPERSRAQTHGSESGNALIALGLSHFPLSCIRVSEAPIGASFRISEGPPELLSSVSAVISIKCPKPGYPCPGDRGTPGVPLSAGQGYPVLHGSSLGLYEPTPGGQSAAGATQSPCVPVTCTVRDSVANGTCRRSPQSMAIRACRGGALKQWPGGEGKEGRFDFCRPSYVVRRGANT